MSGTMAGGSPGALNALTRDGFGWMQEGEVRLPVPETRRPRRLQRLRAALRRHLRRGTRPRPPGRERQAGLPALRRRSECITLRLAGTGPEITLAAGGSGDGQALELVVPPHMVVSIRREESACQPNRSS